MSEPVVDIRNVVKRFAGHTAVRDVTWRVPRGVVYGLLGPNGAGKTTTIRMLLNIIAPDEGQITVFGVPNRTKGLTDRIGYLPEERGLYRKMQVRRLLRFLAELKGVPSVFELARDREQRQVLEYLYAGQDIGRPFVAPPLLPPARLTLLREAFNATMKDPEFIADVKRGKFDLDPESGDHLEMLIKKLYATPKPVIERVSRLIK